MNEYLNEFKSIENFKTGLNKFCTEFNRLKILNISRFVILLIRVLSLVWSEIE